MFVLSFYYPFPPRSSAHTKAKDERECVESDVDLKLEFLNRSSAQCFHTSDKLSLIVNHFERIQRRSIL